MIFLPRFAGLHMIFPPKFAGLHMIFPLIFAGLHMIFPPRFAGLHMIFPPRFAGLHMIFPPRFAGLHIMCIIFPPRFASMRIMWTIAYFIPFSPRLSVLLLLLGVMLETQTMGLLTSQSLHARYTCNPAPLVCDRAKPRAHKNGD